MDLKTALLRFNARDYAGLVVRPLLQETITSAAQADISDAAFTVPADYVCILNTGTVRGSAGAAQTCSVLELRVNDSSGTMMSVLFRKENATTQTDNINVPLADLWIPSGARIVGRVVFSAGAAANSVYTSLSGLLIPRGNFPSL